MLTIFRDVDHWIYLPTENSREQFISAIISEGFRIRSTNKADSDHPFSYGIQIYRREQVTQEAIDTCTFLIEKIAHELGGEYDGWETPVEK